MNNYLSHRWPSGSPAPVTAPPPPPQKPKKKRRGLRVVLIILLCLLIAGAIAAGAYFGILWAADHFDFSFRFHNPSGEVTPEPSAPAATVPGDVVPTWSDKDLPWTQPDPSTTISLTPPSEKQLTPQEVYNSVLPSVVYVEVKQKGSELYSAGSGVVLTESGYIATNFHIIDGGEDIRIMVLPDEIGYEAKLVGYDEEFDLAILKTDAPGLAPATLADSDRLQVGDPVYAIGNPIGILIGSMTEGIVSSLARQVTIDEHTMTLIQISASLNSGNSGGALVDAYGQVVGITVAKFTGLRGDTVVEGIGLAIPITDMIPFINHIIHTGVSCRPSLGILCYEGALGDQHGILVQETTAGTPAARFLQPGDLIIAANGKPLRKFHDLTRVLYSTGVDNAVELTVIRGEETLSVSIILYDRLAR